MIFSATTYDGGDRKFVLLGILEQVEHVVADNDPGLAAEDVLDTHDDLSCFRQPCTRWRGSFDEDRCPTQRSVARRARCMGSGQAPISLFGLPRVIVGHVCLCALRDGSRVDCRGSTRQQRESSDVKNARSYVGVVFVVDDRTSTAVLTCPVTLVGVAATPPGHRLDKTQSLLLTVRFRPRGPARSSLTLGKAPPSLELHPGLPLTTRNGNKPPPACLRGTSTQDPVGLCVGQASRSHTQVGEILDTLNVRFRKKRYLGRGRSSIMYAYVPERIYMPPPFLSTPGGYPKKGLSRALVTRPLELVKQQVDLAVHRQDLAGAHLFDLIV